MIQSILVFNEIVSFSPTNICKTLSNYLLEHLTVQFQAQYKLFHNHTSIEISA